MISAIGSARWSLQRSPPHTHLNRELVLQFQWSQIIFQVIGIVIILYEYSSHSRTSNLWDVKERIRDIVTESFGGEIDEIYCRIGTTHS